MSAPATAARLAALAAALGLALAPAGARAQAGPEPVYQRTVEDAVTADNAPVAFAHPAAGCPAERPCRLPDENPEDPARLVDHYTSDLYERPLAGPGAAVTEAIDIVSARVGRDDERLYYRVDLFAADAGGRLPHAYGFEIDYDDDDTAGDIMVTVEAARLGTAFASEGVVALWNRMSTISGPTPGLPDEPGVLPPGFEVRAFDGGENLLPDAPGGADAVVARIAPDRPASIELAVRRDFLAAVNKGVAVVKVAFRPDAALARLPVASYAVHDRLRRSEAGSPYPFLREAGGPEACPVEERSIPPSQRMALDTGTGTDTGHPNPCYPTRSLAGYDNMRFVVFDPRDPESGSGAGRPDLAVSATHRDDLVRGRRTTLEVSVRNVGTVATTGPVTLTDRLPAGLRAGVASGPGWACSVSRRTVSCATRQPLGPGEAATVLVPVAVDADPGEVRNEVDAVTPGDAQPANNAATDVALVVAGQSFPALPLAGAAAATTAVVLVWRGRRRRTDGAAAVSPPRTPRPSP